MLNLVIMTQKTDKHSEDKRTNADLLAVAKNIRPLVQKILGQNGIMQVEMQVIKQE